MPNRVPRNLGPRGRYMQSMDTTFLGRKMREHHSKQLAAYGATRRARRFDPNNELASLEKQTSGLGVKSAQGAIARQIVRNTQQRTASQTPTAATGGGTFTASGRRGTIIQGLPSGSGSVEVVGSYERVGVLGGQKVIFRYTTYRRGDGFSWTTKEIVDYL